MITYARGADREALAAALFWGATRRTSCARVVQTRPARVL